MEALTNNTPLAYEIHLKSGKALMTISDAAMLIRQLTDNQRCLLHWQTARTNLYAAAESPRDRSILLNATQALHNALSTDNLL